MNKPPKIDRKSLKNPDQFMKRGQEVVANLGQRNLLLPGLAILMVVLFGVYGASWWSERKLDNAWRAYAEAEKLPEDTRWESFKSMESRFGSNRASLFAVVALGDHYFDEAKKEALKTPAGDAAKAAAEALNWYGRALSYSLLEPTEKQLLYVNRGSVQEILGKVDDAAGDYQKAADIDGHAKGFALLNLARAQELKNDLPKATETYNKVAADYGDSEFGKQAKTALRRLKGAIYKDQAKG